MARVAAVVPARDEASTVAETVKATLALPEMAVVVVVDDGSTDETASRAEEAGANVVRLAHGAGKGAALEAGLAALDAAEAGPGGRDRAQAADDLGGPFDAVLFLDADLGSSAAQAALLLAPVLAGRADMTVAAFPPVAPGSGGFGLVKGLARLGIRTLGSKTYAAEAPLSGQRALGPATLAAVRPLAHGYGAEVALTIRALRAGLNVSEVPTTMTHRHTGRDAAGFAHRGRQLLDVAATLARIAVGR